MTDLKLLASTIEKDLQSLSLRNDPFRKENSVEEKIQECLASRLSVIPQHLQMRVYEDFRGWGPLTELLEDHTVTEILVNGPDSVYIERNGKLHRHPDQFLSDFTFRLFLNKLLLELNESLSLENPFVNAKWRDFRIHIIGADLAQEHPYLSLRRSLKRNWSLVELREKMWARPDEIETLKRLIHERNNLLVIGTTGSGKTTVLSALLSEIPLNERVVILEDTDELNPANTLSAKLLTRSLAKSKLASIGLDELLKQSLRMRPDRLVIGEVRSSEAKDLLLALSTGHSGSMGTLHAASPHQALKRLEMLIQMGAPQWNTETIRSLIFLSLNHIVVVGKNSEGQRELQGIYALCSLEKNGILLQPLFEKNPIRRN